ENILQRAFALADNKLIEHLELPEIDVSEATVANTADTIFSLPVIKSSSPGFSLEKHLEAVEKNAIQAALEECRWNKTEAAKKLGMSFRSFRYRVKKLGLD